MLLFLRVRPFQLQERGGERARKTGDRERASRQKSKKRANGRRKNKKHTNKPRVKSELALALSLSFASSFSLFFLLLRERPSLPLSRSLQRRRSPYQNTDTTGFLSLYILLHNSPQQRQRRRTRFQRPTPPLLLPFSRRSRLSPPLSLFSSPLSPLASSSARCSCALENARESSAAVSGGSSAAPAASFGGSIRIEAERERERKCVDRFFSSSSLHRFTFSFFTALPSREKGSENSGCVSCLSPFSTAAT